MAILYVTARNASRDLGPSSPPNLISSSQGAAGNRGKEGCVVGEGNGEGEVGGGDGRGGFGGKEVWGSQEGVTR